MPNDIVKFRPAEQGPASQDKLHLIIFFISFTQTKKHPSLGACGPDSIGKVPPQAILNFSWLRTKPDPVATPDSIGGWIPPPARKCYALTLLTDNRFSNKYDIITEEISNHLCWNQDQPPLKLPVGQPQNHYRLSQAVWV